MKPWRKELKRQTWLLKRIYTHSTKGELEVWSMVTRKQVVTSMLASTQMKASLRLASARIEQDKRTEEKKSPYIMSWFGQLS